MLILPEDVSPKSCFFSCLATVVLERSSKVNSSIYSAFLKREKMFSCNIENCGKTFNRKDNLKRHQISAHLNKENAVEKCLLCGQIFNNCDEIQEHYLSYHKPSKRFIVKESAFSKKFTTFRYTFDEKENDFIGAQTKLRKKVKNLIMNESAQKIITKISLIFWAEMIMEDMNGEKVTQAAIPFRASTFYANANNEKNVNFSIRKCFTQQQNHLDEFMRSGSNWRFSRALAFDVEVAGVNPIRGGCWNVLNSKFKNKLNLYNPMNKDGKCFLYCIAYFLLFGMIVNKKLTLDDQYQIKKMTKKFDTSKITFPIAIHDIKRFLNKNPQLDLKVNVLYRNSADNIWPLEYGLGNGKKVLTLLLVETSNGSHFMVVKNCNNFLKKVYANKKQTNKKSYAKKFFCLNCLNGFSSQAILDKHERLCSLNKPRLEEMPDEKNNKVYFKHFERKHFLDYIAFLDFECVLPDVQKKCNSCASLKCKCDCSFTTEINIQEPICYSFLVLGPKDKIIHEKTFSGVNAHIHFLDHLLEQEEAWIKGLINSNKAMVMDKKDEKDFYKSKECYLCKRPFNQTIIKCRDHSHFTGRYIGAACQRCNLRRRMPVTIKIFVHNLAKYDMHFIIKGLSNFREKIHNLSVLPYNGENFRTLRFNSFEFIDTLAFLQASLGQLTADLRLTTHDYPILKQTYLVKKRGSYCHERLEMVLEKSFFPYEYCKSYQQMKETTSLPSINEFYSNLSGKTISEEDYKFAQSVWKEFQCRNLIDYCEKYCKIDTVLLAEVFQKFRRQMHEFSGVDPAHYISLPSFGYDSMLHITKSTIELPTDINIVHFLERGKRGGVSFINNRQAEADENGDIVYIDANNL